MSEGGDDDAVFYIRYLACYETVYLENMIIIYDSPYTEEDPELEMDGLQENCLTLKELRGKLLSLSQEPKETA